MSGPKMKEIICKCGCGRKRLVRVADIKRGWGRFFDKSCKARYQTRLYGSSKRKTHDIEDDFNPFDSYSLGQG